jgi:hypothetical protein
MNDQRHLTDPGYAVRRGGAIYDLADWRTHRPQRIFEKPPRVAIVVGSFAAVPYIHLHLEARRRFYPEVPLLVQDDCSPFGEQLAALCATYGAELSTNAKRLPACKGDMTAMAHGMVWAREQKIELLVKMSRRFVPRVCWAEDLASLAMESQYATYSSWTTTFNFGFRTECLAFAVEEWMRLGLFDALLDSIFDSEQPFVERLVHGLARRAAFGNSEAAQAYDLAVGQRPRDRDGYAPWPFMGTDRRAVSSDYLWHDWARAEDYARQAVEWGLPYGKSDFADPNMGCGRLPK